MIIINRDLEARDNAIFEAKYLLRKIADKRYSEYNRKDAIIRLRELINEFDLTKEELDK